MINLLIGIFIGTAFGLAIAALCVFARPVPVLEDEDADLRNPVYRNFLRDRE